MTDPRKKRPPDETPAQPPPKPPPKPPPPPEPTRPGQLGHENDVTRTEVHEAAFFNFSGSLTEEPAGPPSPGPVVAGPAAVPAAPGTPPVPDTDTTRTEMDGAFDTPSAPAGPEPVPPAAAAPEPATPPPPERRAAPEPPTATPTAGDPPAPSTRTELRPDLEPTTRTGAGQEAAASTKTEYAPEGAPRSSERARAPSIAPVESDLAPPTHSGTVPEGSTPTKTEHLPEGEARSRAQPRTEAAAPTKTELRPDAAAGARAAPDADLAAPTKTVADAAAGVAGDLAAPTKTVADAGATGDADLTHTYEAPRAGRAAPAAPPEPAAEPVTRTAPEPNIDGEAETATELPPAATATPPVHFEAPNEVRGDAPPASRRAAPVRRSRQLRAARPKRTLLSGVLRSLGSLFRKRAAPWQQRDWRAFESEIAEDGATTSSRPEELQTDSSFLKGLAEVPTIHEAAAETAGDPAPSPAEAAASSSSHARARPARTTARVALRQKLARAAKGLATKLYPPNPAGEPLERLRHTAQWWRRTVTEIAMLFAIIVPIEMAVTGGRVGGFGVHPHPYWIIVLPMAAARGVVAGLLGAAFASLLYAVGALQALHASEISALFTLKNMTEPILFFAAGFLVGEFHDDLATRHRHVERKLKETEDKAERWRKERDVLADANKILERRIVDHSAQFGNLIAAARRIEESGRTEVFEVALDLVEEHCGASASVLLVLDDQRVDLLCSRGWPDATASERLNESRKSDFVARAVAEGTTVNGFAEGETAPASGPLVVAPLFDASGVVKALLCLDDIPASRLNESTVATFQGIAEWISASLARMARGAEPPNPREGFQVAPGPEAWLGTMEELGDRLRLEIERCSRYGVPTSFLAIQMTEWRDASREGVMMLDRYVLMHFTDGLRPSDGIYRFGYPGCYLLVLAGTAIEGAEVVRTRLLRRVEYSPIRGVGAVEIFATGPDVEAPDLASLAARVADRFRSASPLPLEGMCPVKVPESSQVGSIDAFLRRVKMEISLAVRNGFDLHVIGITAEVQDPAAANILARHVRDAGSQILRQTDGVFGIGPYQAAVILPCTAAEHAAEISHRLVHGVRERDPDAVYGDVRTKVLGLGPSHPDPGSFLAALVRAKPGEVAEPPAAPEPAPDPAAAPPEEGKA